MRTVEISPKAIVKAIVAIAPQCYAQTTGEGKPAPVDVSLTAMHPAG
jgi:hypothetical protein